MADGLRFLLASCESSVTHGVGEVVLATNIISGAKTGAMRAGAPPRSPPPRPLIIAILTHNRIATVAARMTGGSTLLPVSDV